jgi:ribose 5-phosphate isomerase B
MTKAHNDANVLCFGARVVDQDTAFAMVDTWLGTEFMGDKHLRRINEIEDLDF